jgi:error-prone DNA polymerase
MVHPYLRRRAGLERVEFPHPALKTILAKTYGVPLFQEQIMRMAMEVAGFSGGEADELRRAMGSWRRTGNIAAVGDKFRRGLMQKGISREFAERVFQQIEGFAEYGFPESHAASFALLAYATAYLRFHYPDCYLAAILNSQPMGFYGKHTLIHDAERHEVKVLGIDVQVSDWDNQVEGKGQVRLGFREIKGFSEAAGRCLLATRGSGFASFTDLVSRWREALSPQPLRKRDLFLLAGANALQGVGLERRQALWEIQALALQDAADFSPPEESPRLPRESAWDGVVLDYDAQGICLAQHPMQLLREAAKKTGILTSSEVKVAPAKRRVKIAGLVISRQMPGTASGVLFVTLEDEFGFANAVIWRRVFEKFRAPLLEQSLLCCEGMVEKADDGDVTHVIVDRVYPLLEIEGLRYTSHDFH